MGKRRASLVFVVLLVFGLAAAYAGWRIVRDPSSKSCDVCRRPLHARSRAVALVDGRKETFCCPACARTARLQSGRAVRIISLTDYETDAGIPPDKAFIVRGGEPNHCARRQALVDENKHPAAEQFDRCSPSIVAFARKEAARAFAARTGGTMMRFDELESK